MDNVTHTLAGAALGEAGLKRLTGLSMATLMIAANIPDVDVLAIPFGEGLTFRRGWTHGPIGILVLPMVLSLCIVAFDRWQFRRGTRPANRAEVRPAAILALAYIGALSHPLLDWLNTYGIRFLMPFSETWFYGDTLFIVDPWVWLMLGIGIWLSRRRKKYGKSSAGRPALIAVCATVLYIGGMIGGSRIAHDHALVEAQDAHEVTDLMAGPVPINPFRRELIVETAEAYRYGSVALLPKLKVRIDHDSIPKNLDALRQESVHAREDVQGFLSWSRYPYVDTGEEQGPLIIRDARFARHRGGDWASIAIPRESAEK